MSDIITFGSASQDIYVKSKKFLPAFGKKFAGGKGICMSLGSKIEVDDIFFSLGGGGTNTAATFASQGLKVSFCGQVGRDYFGNLIINELKRLKIGTDLILRTKDKPTNISVFLTYPGKDRTILVYRGASDELEKKDIPWQKIKRAKWFYLSPFSGKLAELSEELANFARKNGIKTAWNPGYSQLKFPEPVLKRILSKIDILILNKEEACLLAKFSFWQEKKIFQKIGRMKKGIVIITKGKKGAALWDGKCLYRSPALKARRIDGTGAGDSFGSAFVAGMIKKNEIEFAFQLAAANAASCIGQWGAKKGLLKKNQKWSKVKVSKDFSLDKSYAG